MNERKILTRIFVLAMAGICVVSFGAHADIPKSAKADRPVMLPQPTDNNQDSLLESLDPKRFGLPKPDEAFGAYQRGFYLTAYELAKPKAEAGDGPSQALIAELYARGLGVRRDQEKAAQWYEKAAAHKIPEAQFRYGALLLQGQYVAQDRARAEALMQEAAEAGIAMAQFNYGQMLMQKHPGAEGNEKAFPWFEKAAEANIPDAAYAVSQILTNGAGSIERDDAQARDYLFKAAQQGYDTAQLDLATWLIEGRGGERDYENGFRWMRIVANRGNVAAMARLARLYRDGIGTDGDTIEAASWYMRAKKAGLVEPDLEDVLNGLDDEELKLAAEISEQKP